MKKTTKRAPFKQAKGYVESGKPTLVGIVTPVEFVETASAPSVLPENTSKKKVKGKTIKRELGLDAFTLPVLGVVSDADPVPESVDAASQHAASVQGSSDAADALTCAGLQLTLTKEESQKLVASCSVTLSASKRYAPSGLGCTFKTLPLGAVFVFKRMPEGPPCMKVGNTSYLYGLITSVTAALPQRMNQKERASGKDRVIALTASIEYGAASPD